MSYNSSRRRSRNDNNNNINDDDAVHSNVTASSPDASADRTTEEEEEAVFEGWEVEEEDLDHEPACSEILHWTADPDDSFSDWTIEIVVVEGGAGEEAIHRNNTTLDHRKARDATSPSHPSLDTTSTNTTITRRYHVHKNILGYGWKRCEYFRRLFQHSHHRGSSSTDDNCHDSARSLFQESQSSISRIELVPLAAKVFPVFLDFLYAPPTSMGVTSTSTSAAERSTTLFTTENATALYSLGEYFECPRLRGQVRQFVREDLSLDNAHIYYQHATLELPQVGLFRRAVLQLCMDNLSSIQVDLHTPLFQIPDPDLWLDILRGHHRKAQAAAVEASEATVECSAHKSLLVAAYCSRNELDYETFLQLTDERLLPEIDFGAAQTLLELESELQLLHSQKQQQQDDQNDMLGESTAAMATATTTTPPVLSSLQRRCATALAHHWHQLDTTEKGQAFFSKLPPLLVTHILLQGLALAQTKTAVTTSELSYLRRRSSRLELHLESSLPDAIFVSGSSRYPEIHGIYQRTMTTTATARASDDQHQHHNHQQLNDCYQGWAHYEKQGTGRVCAIFKKLCLSEWQWCIALGPRHQFEYHKAKGTADGILPPQSGWWTEFPAGYRSPEPSLVLEYRFSTATATTRTTTPGAGTTFSAAGALTVGNATERSSGAAPGEAAAAEAVVEGGAGGLGGHGA